MIAKCFEDSIEHRLVPRLRQDYVDVILEPRNLDLSCEIRLILNRRLGRKLAFLKRLDEFVLRRRAVGSCCGNYRKVSVVAERAKRICDLS
jgi:hypothetical protein